MNRGTRDELLAHLAGVVRTVAVAHPTRVAVDGPPAAGKTTLADDLAGVLRAEGREVVRATIDDFLVPRARRYPRGEFSAEGCYLDAHDHGALTRMLLDPLGPGGDRRIRRAVYDRTTDTAVAAPVMTAAADAVLVFDGVFLLRPELIARWDLRVLVTAAPGITVERAVARERRASSRAGVERRWHERYIPAQRLYVARVAPADHADVVVHNDDPRRPVWESGRVRGGPVADRPAPGWHASAVHPIRFAETSPGNWSLMLTAGTTDVDDVIEDLAHEPNGYFWEGVAQLLVDTEAPHLRGRFAYDPEGGMFVAHGSDRPALDELAALMTAVATDADRLRRLVSLARERGFEFDD